MSLATVSSLHIFSFLAAGLFGALIGLEREARDKGAGLRTHTLVSLGSCLFTVISIDSVANIPNGDPTRIAAQIVSGIGFLGGGAIIQERDKVHGLTTAATVWISAAIGMACGMKEIAAALIVSLLTLTFLFVFRRVSRTFRRPRMTWLLKIKLKNEIDHTELSSLENKLETSLKNQGFKLLELTEKSSESLEFVIRGQGKLSALVQEIKAYLPESLEIDLKEF
ncbi:MAG: MgtC/SapB family protein [Candidatus Caenarcaniphilales bacterium]|nr:MgtC/SapB family protein [Candidatus Caenarcaniphilales bacterium]